MLHSVGTGGLQLFVSKDGKAVLGSAARATPQPAQSASSAPSKTLPLPDS